MFWTAFHDLPVLAFRRGRISGGRRVEKALALAVLVLMGVQLLRAATYEELNAAFGAAIWADDNLWDDADAGVAERLGWPRESETSKDASFRLYTGEQVRILGAHPYSVALYGANGRPVQISMVFANKGDSRGLWKSRNNPILLERARKDFKRDFIADARAIKATLTKLLGEPRADRFGQGKKTRELVKRWDWKGHAILLATPREEYVAVRVLPVDAADGETTGRIRDVDLKIHLEKNVERRSNGDVVVTDIPMVDQGPKGYCVPATWERVMRYMGIPADMYVLAMAGDTRLGGGTIVGSIIQGASESITRSGRSISNVYSNVDIANISKYIDKGLPVMWAMYSVGEVNARVNLRTIERGGLADVKKWNARLAADRRQASRIKIDRRRGHCCMIIGYNKETGEIATSDSWGDFYKERWMTEEEANAVSQGRIMVIGF